MKKFTKAILFGCGFLGAAACINDLIFKSMDDIYVELDNFYTWKFGSIHYSVKGSGEPILLIHDTISGSGIHEWENNINLLSKYYTVYAIDLLGFGNSDKPRITYSGYLYISLINDFIKNVINKKTSIIASGNSASFAVVAELFSPDMINKLILVSPKGGNYPTKKDSILKFILESPIIGTSIYNIKNSKLYIEYLLSKYFYYNEDSDFKDKFYISAHMGGPSSKYSALASEFNYLNINLNKHIRNVTAPIHVIWGENDEINPIENYNSIAKNCPDVSLSIFEDTKSMPHVENPKEFYKTCKMFLRQ